MTIRVKRHCVMPGKEFHPGNEYEVTPEEHDALRLAEVLEGMPEPKPIMPFPESKARTPKSPNRSEV